MSVFLLYLWLLITTLLISSSLRPLFCLPFSNIYGFWLHFWYLQTFGHYFVWLSLIFMASDYTFDIFKPLAIILSVFLLYLWLLITLLISSNLWSLWCLSFSYIYGFWLLHFWYLQSTGHYFVCLSLIFMASDYYTFDIFKPLAIILSVFLLYLWLLISTLLISSNHWPLFVCLSLIFMASDYTFDIFKLLPIILSVFLLYLWLLITTLLISSNLWPLFCLSFSYIYGFWLLHFWYLQTLGHYFVCLSLIFMASDYTFNIFKPLAIILSVFLLYLWLLITLLISSNRWPLFCLSFCYIYGFWLHFWYLQTFGHYVVCLSLIFMASDYTFDIFKPLAIILSVFLLYLWLLITLLISSNLWPLFCLSFCYIYGFWLHFWYLQTFGHYVVCLSLIFTASDYTFDMFKPLAIILSVFLLYLWLLITLLISSNHWPLFCLSFSYIYGFWLLHFWYLQTLAIIVSLILASDYTFGLFCLSFSYIYGFWLHFWYLQTFLLYLWLLITLLISSNLWPLFCLSFCYIYGFWLHLWYLQSIGHYFVCLSLIFMASDCYTFDIFKPLAIILCVFLLYLWLLITTLLIFSNLWPLFCLSFSYIYDFWFLHFWYLQIFSHYFVCLSLIFMASDYYTFDIFKPLAIILSVFLLYLWLLITTLLISSNLRPLFCLPFSYIYGFWLHFWYLQTFGHYFVCLSLIFMASDYTFDIFKPLAIILSVFLLYLWLLITLLISSNLWALCCLSFSYIYGFWLHFWYVQTFGHYFVCLSLIFMASDYTFDIFKPLAIILSVFLCYIYGFWLHFWYLQTFGHYVVCLSLIFMASDYTFDMFKPLAIILSVFLLYLWLLITLLISSNHWPLFCLSFSYIYGFWLLPFWYLQTTGHYFVCLSLIFMASDYYTFDIFKPLTIILSVFLLYLWLLITLLISSNL